jgi:hypothetical protein
LDILQLAIAKDIVQKSGSWISFSGQKVQGLDRAGIEFPIDAIRELVLRAYDN